MLRFSASIPVLALTLLAAVASPAVRAADWNIVLNGRAVHVDAARDWNEANWGLGLEREFDVNSRWVKVALGNGFKDSQDHMSYMAGGGIKRRFRLSSLSPGAYFDVGAVAFMMTRKNVDNNRPFPGILPAITFGSRNFALNVTYIPQQMAEHAINVRRYDADLDGVFFLQLKLDADLFSPRRRRGTRLAAAE